MAINVLYPATIEEDGSFFLIKFPDIPEAMTQGETLKQAFEMAEEVLGLSLEDKNDFPKPSEIKDVRRQFPDKEVA